MRGLTTDKAGAGGSVTLCPDCGCAIGKRDSCGRCAGNGFVHSAPEVVKAAAPVGAVPQVQACSRCLRVERRAGACICEYKSAVGAVPQDLACVEGSQDFVSPTEATRIARMVQQLRNDSEDEAADLIELLASQRRQHRAKHKSYKRRFREAEAALASQAARMGELSGEASHAWEQANNWRAEAERLRANDARYRWLRHKLTCGRPNDDEAAAIIGSKSADELDAAIDKLRGEAGHG